MTPVPSRDRRIQRALLEHLEQPDYRPMSQRRLLHELHVPPTERATVRRVLGRLVDQGRVRKVRGGRLVATRRVTASPRERPGSAAGPRVVVGVYVRRGREGTVEPFDATLRETIRVPDAFRGDAAPMHAVRVSLLPRRGDGELDGKILETIGHLDDPGTDAAVITAKYGLASSFPPDVLEEAGALPEAAPRDEIARRTRFDEPPPVTIDGETARDFDDAVAVERLGDGGFRLFVHVADVSHYVQPDSALDREARARGTSVYFPDRVLPMLPEALSNELCSLKPQCDRLVQSVVCDVEPNGDLRAVRFADGVIRSAARLTYTGVARALEGEGEAIPSAVRPMIEDANALRRVLERRRRERGSIDFDLPEPQILLDVEGAMTGVTIEPRNVAHRMIEEFMIYANEAVAGYLDEHGPACVYRVHESPDPVKLDALAGFAARFGLEVRFDPHDPSPGRIQALIDSAGDGPEQKILAQVALRSMKQARYTPDPGVHFGLAAPSYCHFTSPIRRYPDLIVHRLLRAARGRGRPPRANLETIAERCSELERNAEAAERELLTWKKVAYAAGRVGEEAEGFVTAVTGFGLFVQLVDDMIEGLVRVERLGEEWFRFDEDAMELEGSSSGKRYRMGDRLAVRIVRVDRVRLWIDLELAGRRPERAGPRRGRGRRTRRRG